MRVAIGCDHAGFPLQSVAIDSVKALGQEVLDLGAHSFEPIDYPDIAESVARAIQTGQADRGIVLCGSGVGAAIAANKLRGIRASVCHDTYSARQGVEHDDMNILCLGARVIGPSLATALIEAFLKATFSGEARHVRRVGKITALESRRE